MARFLSRSEPGKALSKQIQGDSRVVFLDWGSGTDVDEPEIQGLALALGDAPIHKIELPGASYAITKAKHRDLNNIYDRILAEIGTPSSAYMFSYEGHYSILASKLVKLGSKVCLVEDGLGTYVHSQSNNRVLLPGFISTLGFAVRGFLGPIIFRTPDHSISRLFVRFVRELVWLVIGGSIPDKKVLTQGFRNFDTCYTSFPEVAKQIFPDSEHLEVSFAEVMIDQNLSPESRAMTSQFGRADSLFLAQVYVFTQAQLERIYLAALELSEGDCWIKLHPRTSELQKELIFAAVTGVGSARLKFAIDSSPAENMIQALKPKLVISLASTSLAYVEKLSPSSQAVSLAGFALSILAERPNRRSKRVIKTLSADAAVLKYFPRIRELNPRRVDGL